VVPPVPAALSYQTQEAAARAADLGRLALLGPQPQGKPYNFPLASYTPEQQQQRTGGWVWWSPVAPARMEGLDRVVRHSTCHASVSNGLQHLTCC
jgi:hypothetical protein